MQTTQVCPQHQEINSKCTPHKRGSLSGFPSQGCSAPLKCSGSVSYSVLSSSTKPRASQTSIHVHAHMHLHARMHTHTCMYMRTHTHTCKHMNARMCTQWASDAAERPTSERSAQNRGCLPGTKGSSRPRHVLRETSGLS